MGMGDELMATGLVKLMHQKSGKLVRIVDARGQIRRHEIFANNPKIVQPGQPARDFETLRNHSGSGRPYFESQDDHKFTFKKFKPEPGEIFFTEEEKKFAASYDPIVIVEPNIKHAVSVDNKDWGYQRWEELATLMSDAGIPFTQLGAKNPKLKILPGANYIVTSTFRHAAAIIAKAKALVIPEGGLHHAAAAVGVRAVVIYGGFISPDQTGYDSHINLFTGEYACGSKFSCPHCKEAMSKITPQEVFAHLKSLLPTTLTSQTVYTTPQTSLR